MVPSTASAKLLYAAVALAGSLLLILNLPASDGTGSASGTFRAESLLPGDPDARFPAPSGRRSIPLEDFDSHQWEVHAASGPALPTVAYSTERATQGSGSLHLRTSITPEPGDLNDNTARLEIALPESEDWSEFEFVTVDIYMAENPTGLAEARLYLENSAGDSAETPLILGWQLFQWENYQMTFPLKGNTYRIAEIPAAILSDVKRVGIAVTRFSDGGFGTPYEELNFYLDNMRLGGTELWDGFDQPRWVWESSEPDSGVTHNQRFAASAGSLRVSGEATATPRFALAETTPVGVVSARAKSLDGAVALELAITTGGGTYIVDSESAFEADGDGWGTVIWELPETVRPNEIAQLGFRTRAGSIVYLDSIELVSDLAQPFDVDVSPLGDRTAVQWRNPFEPTADVVEVWAQGVDANTRSVVCEVPAVTETGSCLHDTTGNPPQDYVYTILPAGSDGTGTRASANSRTIRYRPDGARYELGLAADNGSLRYLQNVETGAVLSTGSFDDELWSLTFLDETTFHTLSSNQFSTESPTHRFTLTENPFRLIYDYNEAGRRLVLTIDVVPLDAERFDLRASITNDTGHAIRTVSLPRSLSFDLNGMERVLFPIQEGLTLLPQFFAENRSTMMARPPMFADVLAYEGREGHLALHMVQDSTYQGTVLPGQPPDEPVFQPNNLGTGGRGDQGYFRLDMVTFIPDGASWESGAVRISIDRSFRQVAADYRVDNSIDEYPSLVEKLGGVDAFQQLAASPILAVEVYKAVEWQKTPEGETWNLIGEEWLDRLPEPGVLHLTHWQEGRDWYASDNENHKLEDDHPEALPIWWERYGSEADFLRLLNTLEDRDYLTMPFTNWTVWNTYDPVSLEIPTLDETPAAATKLRGPEYPHLEYKGYMVEPWSPDVRDRNTRMFETYTEVYPQDIMFVDMTGERSWRYVALEDGNTMSAAAYTQGVVNENARLSELKPLFTEGVFDRIGNSVTGYAQTLRQKFWNQILAHVGQEYVHWTAYPFAADVLHDKVAFYQHDLNAEVWPGEEMALATYYSLNGYNYMVDVTKHLGEDEETIWALDAMQKSVNARTFGQPLLDERTAPGSPGVQWRTWGPLENPLEITANFDVDTGDKPYVLDGYGIAPDGFVARTAAGDMVAGMFVGEFDGAPLADGLHWITVERTSDRVEIRHPIGVTTPIRVARANDWVDEAQISVVYELADNSMVSTDAAISIIDADALHVTVPTELSGMPVRNVIVAYGELPAEWDVKPASPESGLAAAWQVDPQSAQRWRTENTAWNTASGTLSLAVTGVDAAVGRAESEAIAVEFGAAPSLMLDIAAITPASRLIVQIQEAFGDYRAFDALAVADAGKYAVEVNEVSGSTASNRYTIVLWLEGIGARVDFTSIQMTSSGRVGTDGGVAFEETFDAGIEGWILDNVTAETNDGELTARVTDQGVGYGKFETIPLMISIGATPILEVDVTGLDARTAYSVQLQEQFGAYAAIDLRTEVTASSALQLDLREYVNDQGTNPYRLVFWVSGSGILTLDGMTLRAE
ncbi:MAG: hypothetical protein OEP52_02450 [Acidimicrobiia bacterium]|nr:hypothetical protein [Acidimicrobiia bacterium]